MWINLPHQCDDDYVTNVARRSWNRSAATSGASEKRTARVTPASRRSSRRYCACSSAWGPQTSRAVAQLTTDDIIDTIQDFHDDERKFYQAIITHDPSQRKFATDWFGRNDRCEVASLGMVKKGPMV